MDEIIITLTEQARPMSARFLKSVSVNRKAVTAFLASMKCFQIASNGKATMKQYLEFACQELNTDVEILDFTEPKTKPKSTIMAKAPSLGDGIVNKAT
jgi:hypothetical protein